MEFRVGQGIDIHQFKEGRRCIIGGVEIPYEKGLLGHSDADVLLHALMDALLGAIGHGDIGTVFPDTEDLWKGADSLELLKKVSTIVYQEGWKLSNADMTILAEAPKILPFISTMKDRIANSLSVNVTQIGIKATTTETLGFIGRKEGVLAQAVVLLSR